MVSKLHLQYTDLMRSTPCLYWLRFYICLRSAEILNLLSFDISKDSSEHKLSKSVKDYCVVIVELLPLGMPCLDLYTVSSSPFKLNDYTKHVIKLVSQQKAWINTYITEHCQHYGDRYIVFQPWQSPMQLYLAHSSNVMNMPIEFVSSTNHQGCFLIL